MTCINTATTLHSLPTHFQHISGPTVLGVDHPVVVGDEEHGTLEEVGLDEGQVLEVLQVDWLNQQLPFLAVRPVGVDQLLRVRQEVEVVVFIHLQPKSLYSRRSFSSCWLQPVNGLLSFCIIIITTVIIIIIIIITIIIIIIIIIITESSLLLSYQHHYIIIITSIKLDRISFQSTFYICCEEWVATVNKAEIKGIVTL